MIIIENICKDSGKVILPPATKLGQGYIFTGICDSIHRGVCVVAGGVCMVARGACVITGGCVVAGGCAWLLGGTCGCMVAGGGACVGYEEIRKLSLS